MRFAPRRSGLLLPLLAVACAACASGGGGAAIRVNDVTPQSIPSLEAAKSQHPQDPNTLTRLGVAYFKAGRYQDARPVLDSAIAHQPDNGVAAIYLGMTDEQLGDFPAAKRAYADYVAVARNAELKKTAQQRLALADRRAMIYQARQDLANEPALARMPPESNTVAVMPFIYSGSDSTVVPLGRGLAQLLVTDLAKSRQIRVLERERMQAILDEMKLSDSAQVDPATAIRSGRMLRAADVVQGTMATLPGDQLRVDAAVVSVASAQVKASAGNQDPLDRLFDLEKALAFSIFNNLGIQLSPAEREAINQRPTKNLQAFLAYSRGLMAQDNGDFGAAQADFDRASVLDPGFQAALQGAAAASQLSAASQQTVPQVEATVAQATVEAPTAPVTSAQQQALLEGTSSVNPSTGEQLSNQMGSPGGSQPPANKNPVQEAGNDEGAQTPTGTLIIVIQRPK